MPISTPPRVRIPRDWGRVESSQIVPLELLSSCNEERSTSAGEASSSFTTPPHEWRKASRPNSSKAGSNPSTASTSKPSEHACRLFTAEDLQEATQNWAPQNCIGAGGFGTVHRGTLHGRPVAVKRLHPDAKQGPREYLREVHVLSSARHPHLVKLLGHCPELCALVYPYCSNGALHTWLSTPLARSRLTWRHRVKILRGLASALVSLHGGGGGGCSSVVHCDVKPENVLLDKDLMPRLADLGLAREPGMCQDTVWGSPGYVDPELVSTGHVSPLADVYAFGVLALQLVTGEPQVSEVHGAVGHLSKRAPTQADRMESSCERLASCADSLAGDWPPGVAHNLCHVALRCLHKGSMRPSLEHDVIPMLRVMSLLELQRPVGSLGALRKCGSSMLQMHSPNENWVM